jgi:hypothetical protein
MKQIGQTKFAVRGSPFLPPDTAERASQIDRSYLC